MTTLNIHTLFLALTLLTKYVFCSNKLGNCEVKIDHLKDLFVVFKEKLAEENAKLAKNEEFPQEKEQNTSRNYNALTAYKKMLKKLLDFCSFFEDKYIILESNITESALGDSFASRVKASLEKDNREYKSIMKHFDSVRCANKDFEEAKRKHGDIGYPINSKSLLDFFKEIYGLLGIGRGLDSEFSFRNDW